MHGKLARKHVVRILFRLIVLSGLATTADAQSLQVIGYAGVLGEWELTANVTQKTSGRMTSEFYGPLTMTHVGLCTQAGPEQKSGEISFRIFGSSFAMFGSSASIEAKLLVDGVECSYSARLSDAYKGLMNCPDRRAVPLTLWLK